MSTPVILIDLVVNCLDGLHEEAPNVQELHVGASSSSQVSLLCKPHCQGGGELALGESSNDAS